MGLFNGPATFQTLMNSVFRDLIDVFLVVYLDDLLIFSNYGKKNRNHVSLVLICLKENDIYVSPNKCSFFQEEVEFIWFLAGGNVKQVDPAKILAVRKWPAPESLTEMRGLLDLIKFFKNFIKNFSEQANPLPDLTRKDKGINAWNEEWSNSFCNLKEALTNYQVLVAPKWESPFEFHVDASQYSVGSTLTKKTVKEETGW